MMVPGPADSVSKPIFCGQIRWDRETIFILGVLPIKFLTFPLCQDFHEEGVRLLYFLLAVEELTGGLETEFVRLSHRVAQAPR